MKHRNGWQLRGGLMLPLVWVQLMCTQGSQESAQPGAGPVGQPNVSTSMAHESLTPESAGAPAYVHEQSFEPGELAYVLKMTVVRPLGKDGSKPPKGKAPAPVTTLYRGEKVTLQRLQAPWVEVVLSDGQRGLMAPESLLLARGVALVTLLANQQRFARPDFLALDIGTTLEAGSLLYKLRTKDRFAEVQIGGKQTVWCLEDVLVDASREVEAAKLWIRAKSLPQGAGDLAAGSEAIYQLMRQQFADTHLVQLFVAPSQGWSQAPSHPEQIPSPGVPSGDEPPAPDHQPVPETPWGSSKGGANLPSGQPAPLAP